MWDRKRERHGKWKTHGLRKSIKYNIYIVCIQGATNTIERPSQLYILPFVRNSNYGIHLTLFYSLFYCLRVPCLSIFFARVFFLFVYVCVCAHIIRGPLSMFCASFFSSLFSLLFSVYCIFQHGTNAKTRASITS